MCFSSVRSRSISGLSLLQRMNGATAFTSCTSSISGVGHVGERQAPAVHRAQIDLLQVGVELPDRETARAVARLVVRARDLRELRRRADPDARRSPRHARSRRCPSRRAPPSPSARPRVARAPRLHASWPREQRCASVGSSCERHASRARAGARRTRRPAHGLRRVVDQDVERGLRLSQVAREDLDARRVAQVEPVDLQPVAPLSKSASRAKRGAASCGKRVVTITRAPARSIISAAWKPILTRAPVMSATRPSSGAVWKRFGVVELGARRAHRVVEEVELGELAPCRRSSRAAS